jgi:hypothetical protein
MAVIFTGAAPRHLVGKFEQGGEVFKRLMQGTRASNLDSSLGFLMSKALYNILVI